ncbi:hypothetical protein ACM66B_004327 [Microbotryomycetes sp. NB124-2]
MRLSAVQARKAAMDARNSVSQQSAFATTAHGARTDSKTVAATQHDESSLEHDTDRVTMATTNEQNPQLDDDQAAGPRSSVEGQPHKRGPPRQPKSIAAAVATRTSSTRYFAPDNSALDSTQRQEGEQEDGAMHVDDALALPPTEPGSSDEAFASLASQRSGRRARSVAVDPECVSQFVPRANENMFALSESDVTRVLFCLKARETLVIHGVYTLTPVAGSVVCAQALLHGPNSDTPCSAHDLLGRGTPWPVVAPASHPFVPVEARPGQPLPSSFELGDGKRVDLSSFQAAVLVSDLSIGIEMVEPVLRRGGVVAAQGMWPRTGTPNTSCDGRTWELLLEPKPACVLARTVDSWSASFQRIQGDVEQARDAPLVALVQGPKRVGKSTLARQLVNTILQTHAQVAFLDTDLGQPEFAPPGCVSLTVLDRPILVPSFAHAVQPHAIRFCGATSPANDPAAYKAAISSLILLYREQLQDLGPDGYMPIVVNTHGWNKGLGSQLVQQLSFELRPSHVVSFRPMAPQDHDGEVALTSDVTYTAGSCIVVDPVPQLPVESKWSAADLRILHLASHLHSTPRRFEASARSGRAPGPLWEFDKSLLAKPPHLLPFAAGGAPRVSRLWLMGWMCDERHLLRALNGSLVAIAVAAEGDEGGRQGLPVIESDSTRAAHLDVIGLGVVRAIDSDDKVLHVVCPALNSLGAAGAGKVALLKGALELPLALWLDESFDEARDNTGTMCGVEWANVPYLSTSLEEGAGRRRIRRNLMRRAFA